MNKWSTIGVSLLLSFGAMAGFQSCSPKAESGTFEAGKGTFLLNGEPFVVKAAELHYPRMICLYVFWNFHEEKPGEFDFTGQKDLAEFCRLCQKNDMYVILRPGPYVCAEWEMGGLPWWLLKKKDIRFISWNVWLSSRKKLRTKWQD